MKTIDYSQKTYKIANTRSLASMTRTTKIITIQKNRMKKLLERTKKIITIRKKKVMMTTTEIITIQKNRKKKLMKRTNFRLTGATR